MKAVEFNDVSLTLEKNKILDNISFEVEKGEIFGLIGHNGAGKTSLLRILLGLTKGYSGRVSILESDNLCIGRSHIGAVVDSLGVDISLTAPQYIRNISAIRGGIDKKKQIELLERVGLKDTGNKIIAKFSLGMKRRLIIAAALVGNPEILVLDEPFNGIDPEGMADIRLILHQLAAEGKTILVTSHNIPELIKLSTSFGAIYEGKYMGTITERQLSALYYIKTVFKTTNPQILKSGIMQKYPDCTCYAGSQGEIIVFGNLSEEECLNIKNGIPDNGITGVTTISMSEEEILLWNMNGHR